MSCNNMGLGKLGKSDVVFRNKVRWTIEFPELGIEECFVKLAARPNLKIEEEEINYLRETVTVTYYDVSGDVDNNEELKKLYSWLGKAWELDDKGNTRPTAEENRTTVILRLYGGCGDLWEAWTLMEVFPKAINFGDLDFSSSGCVTLELTLGYTDVKYEMNTPTPKATPNVWTAAPPLEAKEAQVESKEEPFCSTGNYWMDIEALASHKKAKGVEGIVEERGIRLSDSCGHIMDVRDDYDPKEIKLSELPDSPEVEPFGGWKFGSSSCKGKFPKDDALK